MVGMVHVGLHRPTQKYAPVSYVYDTALEKVSDLNSQKQGRQQNFFLIGNGVIYFDSRFGQELLFNLSDTPEIAVQTMEMIQTTLDDIFENRPLDTGSEDKKSLAQYGCYERPLFERSEPKDDKEKEFENFFVLIGNFCQTPKDKYKLCESIQNQYEPLRNLIKIR